MDCETVRQNLLEYSRGRLNSSEVKDIEDHLGGCEGCRAFLEEERAFDVRLAGLAGPVPENDVWVAIRSATRRRPLLQRLFATPRRLLAAAVAAVSLAAALLIISPAIEKRASENQVVMEQVFMDQAQSQTAQKWVDDPLGATTDRVVAAIEEEL